MRRSRAQIDKQCKLLLITQIINSHRLDKLDKQAERERNEKYVVKAKDDQRHSKYR